MEKEYRKCVGMMILNKENKILVGRRIDHPSGYWQMPQGGIDNKENPEEAVWREMMEEIGTNNAELIMISSHWYSYIIPEETLKTLPWGNEFKGQNKNGLHLDSKVTIKKLMLQLKIQNLVNGNGFIIAILQQILFHLKKNYIKKSSKNLKKILVNN